MPYKPPICPAYAQSQCLTLSPIPEAKSKVNSPVLSCKSSLFSGFEWSSASAVTPLMSQSENVSFSSCATSPAILDKLEQLNLQQKQQVAPGSMPGISSILEQPVPCSTSLNSNLGVGLGFTFLSPAHNGATMTTPFNTPARPIAPKPIVTQFDPAVIQMKLNSLSVPPLTPPYDEDSDDNREEADDNTPLHLWLQYRMEEAKIREEYEKESSDVLMSATPTPDTITKTLTKQVPRVDGATVDVSPVKSMHSTHAREDSEEDSRDDEEYEEQEDVMIVTHGKRISVQESCAIATLKRRSRLMGLHKEAGFIASNDGLPAGLEIDEFGMKIDGDSKGDAVSAPEREANEAEIAMNEDRSSPKYSIFSPTSRLQPRRSVSFAKPEVTQVKTFASTPLEPTHYNKSKAHKRKASATSLSNVSPSEGLPRTSTMIPRSTRSLSTSAVSVNSVSSNTSTNMSMTAGRYKRARRSSSIVSSLAFTSNSLAPIFSSAFLKNTMNDKVDGEEINIASLRSAMKNSMSNARGIDPEDKENDMGIIGKGSAPPTASTHSLGKKRSFGISMSLPFRGKGQ